MPDEQLVRFAIDESQHLTLESFHLLKTEFELRNLDLGIIEKIKDDKELAEAIKISEFEKATAMEFTETIWKFAFDEKEKGKSNTDIFNSLLKKNISSDYAYMLIESIEPKARELVDSFDTEIIVGWIFTIIGGLLVLFTINSETIPKIFLLWGGLSIAGGCLRLSNSYTKKRKFQAIVKNIEAETLEQNNFYQ